MCRFVAVIATNDIPLEPYLNFLKYQAEYGKRSPHGDGFGYWIKAKDGEYYYRTTVPVWKTTLSITKGYLAFFHARKRGESGAPVNINNVHPFVHEGAVFMHNGIVEFEKHPKAIGTTDTESFFLTLLDMNVLRGLKHIVITHPFESLNFVMYKDEKIYIFRYAKVRKNYFTLFIKKEEDRIIISTEKNEDSWREVKNGELITIVPELKLSSSCIFPDMCH